MDEFRVLLLSKTQKCVRTYKVPFFLAVFTVQFVKVSNFRTNLSKSSKCTAKLSSLVDPYFGTNMRK